MTVTKLCKCCKKTKFKESGLYEQMCKTCYTFFSLLEEKKGITQREAEIFTAITAGYSTRQVAKIYKISAARVSQLYHKVRSKILKLRKIWEY